MPQFDATTSADADRIVVALSGECDLTVRDQLTDVLMDAVVRATVITVDLGGVTFLDSTGVNALVAAHHAARRRDARLYATNANGVVADVLDLTGVGKLLTPVGDDGD